MRSLHRQHLSNLLNFCRVFWRNTVFTKDRSTPPSGGNLTNKSRVLEQSRSSHQKMKRWEKTIQARCRGMRDRGATAKPSRRPGMFWQRSSEKGSIARCVGKVWFFVFFRRKMFWLLATCGLGILDIWEFGTGGLGSGMGLVNYLLESMVPSTRSVCSQVKTFHAFACHVNFCRLETGLGCLLACASDGSECPVTSLPWFCGHWVFCREGQLLVLLAKVHRAFRRLTAVGDRSWLGSKDRFDYCQNGYLMNYVAYSRNLFSVD